MTAAKIHKDEHHLSVHHVQSHFDRRLGLIVCMLIELHSLNSFKEFRNEEALSFLLI